VVLAYPFHETVATPELDGRNQTPASHQQQNEFRVADDWNRRRNEGGKDCQPKAAASRWAGNRLVIFMTDSMWLC
jgi:hypothetical protein